MARKRFGRKKYCPFKADPSLAESLSYKNADFLKRFLGDNGKLIPRRLSGVSAYYQRRLTREIKRARHLALLPYSTSGEYFGHRPRSR